MKAIKYNIYQNYTDYYNNNGVVDTLELSDTDIKIWQSIIPNDYVGILVSLLLNYGKNKKQSVLTNIPKSPLFNISSIFNEASNFSSQKYDLLETSFKSDASFLTGMIMAAIYAYTKLNAHEIYHYNAIKYYISYSNNKQASKKIKKPDFLAHNILKDKYYLVEAKGSTGEVKSNAVAKGILQVSNSAKYENINISNGYVVATSFIKNKLHLDVIDPKPKSDAGIIPIECIEELYSKFKSKNIRYSGKQLETGFYLFNLNFEATKTTIGVYDKFYTFQNNKKKLQENWKEFSAAIPSYYSYFSQKYERVIFYNGLMIAYNKENKSN